MGVTPIALDLDGSGIRTTAAADGVHFDLAGTGQTAKVGWVAAGDGLPVRDINGDAAITDGRKLLGVGTRRSDGQRAGHGCAAMTDLDGNHDGQTDLNELKGLADLGIVPLDLNCALTSQDNNGNHVAMVSSDTTSDGQQHEMADVPFAKQPTQAPSWLDEVLAAPPDSLFAGQPAAAPSAAPGGLASHAAWPAPARSLLDGDRLVPLI